MINLHGIYKHKSYYIYDGYRYHIGIIRYYPRYHIGTETVSYHMSLSISYKSVIHFEIGINYNWVKLSNEIVELVTAINQ